MQPGKVIVLNGSTSSGKTTLAKTLQARFASAGDCWIVIALDDFFPKLPADWFRIGSHVGAYAEQGIVFEMIDGEIERRIGPIGVAMIAAYRGAVASAARAGLNVLVDEVLLSEEDWVGWTDDLQGIDVFWVAVEPALAVLEARERDRGDRVIGMARAQYPVVHQFPAYDARVDTGALDPEAAADAVIAARTEVRREART